MQRAKENQHVCLLVRRYTSTNAKDRAYCQTSYIDSHPTYRDSPPMKPSGDNGIRYVTLQKASDNESFGFVIISSHNKTGTTVGKKKRFFKRFYVIFLLNINRFQSRKSTETSGK